MSGVTRQCQWAQLRLLAALTCCGLASIVAESQAASATIATPLIGFLPSDGARGKRRHCVLRVIANTTRVVSAEGPRHARHSHGNNRAMDDHDRDIDRASISSVLERALEEQNIEERMRTFRRSNVCSSWLDIPRISN